jgi:hypothetical protein
LSTPNSTTPTLLTKTIKLIAKLSTSTNNNIYNNNKKTHNIINFINKATTITKLSTSTNNNINDTPSTSLLKQQH